MSSKIKKKICSLYSKQNDEYEILGSGFFIDDKYLITTKNLINENQMSETIYVKIDGEYISLSNDWMFIKDNKIDIAILKLAKTKKEKKSDDFTQDDFQSILKKVSRKVSDKKGK